MLLYNAGFFVSPSLIPRPYLGIPQSDKSIIYYAVLYIQTSFKTPNHKKYIPIEKQIVSTHHRKTETSKTQDY